MLLFFSGSCPELTSIVFPLTETGGMYPELLTRRDLEVFLPPIGGLTVYIFGNPAFMSDETKEMTVRVHDECNGSDVLCVFLLLQTTSST